MNSPSFATWRENNSLCASFHMIHMPGHTPYQAAVLEV